MTLRHRHLLCGVWCVFVALANFGVLTALFNLAEKDDAASHVVVIPFVTLALLALEWRTVFAGARFAWLPGIGAIVMGAGLASANWLAPASSRQGEWLPIATAALVVLWMGGFLLLYGPRAFRAALFPLILLGFTIPIPAALLNPTTTFLQWASADATEALFRLAGLPHYREGLVFKLPHIVIWIAEECSGIRSSIGLLLTTLLAAHLALKTTSAKAMLLVALIPIAVLKNAIRITTLSLLAVHVDPTYLDGWLHHNGGPVFFLIALAMMFGVLALLGRLERPASGASARLAPVGEPG